MMAKKLEETKGHTVKNLIFDRLTQKQKDLLIETKFNILTLNDL